LIILTRVVSVPTARWMEFSMFLQTVIFGNRNELSSGCLHKQEHDMNLSDASSRLTYIHVRCNLQVFLKKKIWASFSPSGYGIEHSRYCSLLDSFNTSSILDGLLPARYLHQCILFLSAEYLLCNIVQVGIIAVLKTVVFFFCGMYTLVIVFVCAESWELVYGLSALFWVMLSNCLWEFPSHYVLTIIFTVQVQKNLELSI
jgi:hypothetical protein